MSASPLERKAAQNPKKPTVMPQPIIEKRTFVPDPPMLPSDTEDAQLTDTENGEISSAAFSHTTANETGDEDEDEEYLEDEEEEDDDDDEWGPPSKTPKSKKVISPSPSPSPRPKSRKPFVPVRTPRVSKLAKDMDNLQIKSPGSGGGAPSILSKKSGKGREFRQATEDDDDDDLLLQPTTIKKKKRYVIHYLVLCCAV